MNHWVLSQPIQKPHFGCIMNVTQLLPSGTDWIYVMPVKAGQKCMVLHIQSVPHPYMALNLI